jgi:hypothetical protein
MVLMTSVLECDALSCQPVENTTHSPSPLLPPRPVFYYSQLSDIEGLAEGKLSTASVEKSDEEGKGGGGGDDDDDHHHHKLHTEPNGSFSRIRSSTCRKRVAADGIPDLC